MLEVYTDGSSKKDLKAGYAFVVVLDGQKIGEKSFSIPNFTNQQAELKAAADGCWYAWLMRDKLNTMRVNIYSDSAYLVNCYKQEWWKNWEKNGWKNAKKQPVANRNLWEKLIPFFRDPSFEFIKVKGHSGQKWNEEADTLAQKAAEACDNSI